MGDNFGLTNAFAKDRATASFVSLQSDGLMVEITRWCQRFKLLKN